MGARQSTQASSQVPVMPPCKGGQDAFAAGQATGTSACPVPEEVRRGPVYNVYNQRIDGENAVASTSQSYFDPRNNMPMQPNQQPSPGQRKLLSTERMQSTIPKGGTSDTWLYPSPQMFYNALKRKSKADDVTEDDMGAVVHTHNTMNELTWQKLQAWEKLHPECADVRLNRFIGRPHDLSPIARVRTMLGMPPPFDRHDWFVVRDGREVRYVIDFYFDDRLAGSPEAFEIEVRPALDSWQAALDRTKMAIYVQCAKWGLPCPVTGDSGRIIEQTQTQT